MNRHILAAIVLTLYTTALDPSSAADRLIIRDAIVTVIDQVEVPSRDRGVLQIWEAYEGMEVREGQVLGNLDPRQALVELARAQSRHAVAQEQANSHAEVELARNHVDRARQAADQHRWTLELAQAKAKSDLRVRAAEAAEAVARNERDRANLARERFADSVSQSELDGLTLALQRCEYERRQATLEHQWDALNVKAEAEAATILATEIAYAQIAVDQAIQTARISRAMADAAGHDAELAEIVVERHRLISPIDGVVVHTLRQSGDWVEIGETVARIIGTKRLRGEGFVPFEAAQWLRSPDRNRLASIQAEIEIKPQESITRPATITFVSPEINPVNGEVRLWVELENEGGEILPGMRMTLTIEPTTAADGAPGAVADTGSADTGIADTGIAIEAAPSP